MLNNKIIRIIFIVVGFVAATVIYAFYTNSNTENLSVISPLSKSFSILAFAGKRETPAKTIYGYLPYWSLDNLDDIQFNRLTDIAYFGLHIDSDGSFLESEDGELIPGYNQWKNNEKVAEMIKKAKDNNVRVALTIISHRDNVSDEFLDCRTCWETLAENIINELIQKDIKDVNLNFEYAEYTPLSKAKQFTEFVEYINNLLDDTFRDSKVVVSSFADSIIKERVSEIEGLAKVADQIFIMGYDFHRPTSDTAGPVAPIGGMGIYADYDLETMIQDYLAYVSPNKLLLGVPYYGYNWVVEKDEEYAKRVEGTEEKGFSQSQTYEQIMETIGDVEPDVKWDDLAKTPYFSYISPTTNQLREVYFDNVESLSFKYELVMQNNLGGVGIWALGYDGSRKELWDLLQRYFVRM